MSLFHRFDPYAFLENQEGTPPKVPKPPKVGSDAGCLAPTLGALGAGRRENANPQSHAWDAEAWHGFYDERSAIVEFDGSLPREAAEVQAFEECVVEWLRKRPPELESSGCAYCGGCVRVGSIVVPFRPEAAGGPWLHPGCWPDWCEEQRAEAVRALAQMGLRQPGVPPVDRH